MGGVISERGLLADMAILIPQSDYRLGQVMLITERTQAGRAQKKMSSGSPRFESEPAGGEHSNKMPAGKNQRVSPDLAHPAHHAIRPRADLSRRLSPGTTVTKQSPVRPLLQDISCAAALVFSVVPFDQIGIDFGHGTEASQFAGASGSLQQAGEHLGDAKFAQSFPEPSGVAGAALSQWQIGQSRMLAGEAPSGFAVAGQVNDWKCFAHSFGHSKMAVPGLLRSNTTRLIVAVRWRSHRFM